MGVGTAIDKARTKLAAKATSILPDRCTISVPGGATTDAYGNTSSTSSTVFDDLPCKLEALSVYERQRAGGLFANATHTLSLPTVWNGDVVTVLPSATVTIAERAIYPARNCTVVGQLLGSNDLWLRVAVEVES